MKEIHKTRMRALINHLRYGTLGHDEFYFGVWNGYRANNPRLFRYDIIPPSFETLQTFSNGCGTRGCAIGECPVLFPDKWEWKDGFPVLSSVIKNETDLQLAVFNSGRKFFGLTEPEMDFLFTGVAWSTEADGTEQGRGVRRKDKFPLLPELNELSTRYQVADVLDIFLGYYAEPAT